MPLASVNWDALLELIWAAPIAVLIVTVAWAMVIHGSVRSADARRDGRTAVAGAHLAVAVIGGMTFFGALAMGIIVMASK